MIYLDNAATSFPKPKSVIREVTECLTKYCGNPGRSSHKLALSAADKIFETRVIIANFLGWKKCENVVFLPSATYALNIVIKLQYVNGRPVAKLSDTPGKAMCRDQYYLEYLKRSVNFRLNREK